MEKLSQPTKVLLIVFPGFNTLDMNGPYDVFSKSGISENFVITVAAETDITKSVEGLLVQVRSGYPFLSDKGGHLSNRNAEKYTS